MKVILLQNVPKVGKKYELVDVAPGYARNFLVARNLCEVVTRTNVKQIAELQKRRSVESAKEDARMEKAVNLLSGAVFEFTREANEDGHLYAQVSAHDIANAIELKAEVAIPTNHISIPTTIKQVGDFAATVTVAGKEIEITIKVIAA
jgi:large subunit ribosomal protein L9